MSGRVHHRCRGSGRRAGICCWRFDGCERGWRSGGSRTRELRGWAGRGRIGRGWMVRSRWEGRRRGGVGSSRRRRKEGCVLLRRRRVGGIRGGSGRGCEGEGLPSDDWQSIHSCRGSGRRVSCIARTGRWWGRIMKRHRGKTSCPSNVPVCARSTTHRYRKREQEHKGGEGRREGRRRWALHNGSVGPL